MASTARFTVKAQRDKLARFSASKVYLAAKPYKKKIYMPPWSASVTPYPSGRDDRAGACRVAR